MTRAGRVLPRLALILAAASCGGLPASSAWAASASAAPAPPSAPTSPLERLEQLDQLHADLELARLRAAIRKANAEGLEPAGGPAVGVAGGPPLPQLGSGNPLLNLSPISAPNQAAEKRKAKGKAEVADVPTFSLVEAWGSGAERQAILHSDAGDRLVRVGDQIPPGVVTAISGGAVTYRDARGQTHVID